MKKIKDFYDSLKDGKRYLTSKTLLKNIRSSTSRSLLEFKNNRDKFIGSCFTKNLYAKDPYLSCSQLRRRLKEIIMETLYGHSGPFD